MLDFEEARARGFALDTGQDPMPIRKTLQNGGRHRPSGTEFRLRLMPLKGNAVWLIYGFLLHALGLCPLHVR